MPFSPILKTLSFGKRRNLKNFWWLFSGTKLGHRPWFSFLFSKLVYVQIIGFQYPFNYYIYSFIENNKWKQSGPFPKTYHLHGTRGITLVIFFWQSILGKGHSISTFHSNKQDSTLLCFLFLWNDRFFSSRRNIPVLNGPLLSGLLRLLSHSSETLTQGPAGTCPVPHSYACSCALPLGTPLPRRECLEGECPGEV